MPPLVLLPLFSSASSFGADATVYEGWPFDATEAARCQTGTSQVTQQPDGWFRDLPVMEGFDPRDAVSRWRPDFQRDFAKRMAWCLPP